MHGVFKFVLPSQNNIKILKVFCPLLTTLIRNSNEIQEKTKQKRKKNTRVSKRLRFPAFSAITPIFQFILLNKPR